MRAPAAAVGGGAVSLRWGRLAHVGDCGGEEGAVFQCSFYADHVADLDVGEGDGIAAFAEGGVLIGDEGVSRVVGAALQGDCEFVDGGDSAHDPRFAVVGLYLAHLFGALGIDLKDDDGADGFCRRLRSHRRRRWRRRL